MIYIYYHQMYLYIQYDMWSACIYIYVYIIMYDLDAFLLVG